MEGSNFPDGGLKHKRNKHATCDNVQCGKGTCKSSLNYTFGFECECNLGWSQFHNFPFSPCVIPNCSINYSCYNNSEAPASSPAPSLTNTSIFDPCFWSYCGGGKCVKTSTFDHRCECEDGFSNLLNIARFPCYKDCSLGVDCANLGITLPNATSPASPPSLPDNSSSVAGGSINYSCYNNSEAPAPSPSTPLTNSSIFDRSINYSCYNNSEAPAPSPSTPLTNSSIFDRSINYSCYNNSEAPAPSPSTPLTNTSIFDPCFWSYCGGGKCIQTSTFDHRCECEEGFSNLLNVTRFPCYKDCSFGVDCANLGIALTNGTSPNSPSSLSDNGSSFAGGKSNFVIKMILFNSLVTGKAF
ncbi:neurogenic locus notch-like protein 1 [Cocos nucifera]|uniref:Neurogenic locus notch-like protein 1 n=1 Tax=Cocos nucifera TaxID=13894 RepID=A0A8K0IGM2_COCNU|nr:neurogenic locus notch-like protein 1 [Cocos nucifera]